MTLITRRAALGAGLSLAAVGAIGYGLWPEMGGYLEEAARQRARLASAPERMDLIRLATLAANGHNAQPWTFRLRENGVTILPDLTRRTAVVDPDDHHLFVSLGCAAENLAIAAQAQGLAAAVTVTAADQPEIDIDLSPRRSPVPVLPGPLYEAIPFRQSTRSLFDGQPISADDLAILAEAARHEGVEMALFTEEADREAILDYVIQGNGAQMDDPAFVAELRSWLRFSPARAMATGDGLFSACSGNPVAPEWIGGPLFQTFFSKAGETDKYRAQVRSSAGIAVFVGDRDDPGHWIKVGQSFQRFSLQATALGIRTAHINQPVEDPALRPEFARWLGMPGARPDLVIRFGRAPAMPMSLRRPLADVVI